MNKNIWYKDFNEYYNQLQTISVINKHHLESYNNFIDNLVDGSMINNPYFRLHKKINQHNLLIEINPEDISIRKDENDNFSKFNPNECRLKDKDYIIEIIISKITIKIDSDTEIPIIFDNNNEFILAKIPIQVLSKYCNLSKNITTSNEMKNELYKNGECINELGGYFIIDGKEKIIISQERLAYNKLYTHKDSSKKYLLITEVKSAEMNSFSPAKNTYIKLKKIRLKENKNAIEEDEEIKIEENTFDKKKDLLDNNEISILVEFPGLKEDIPLFIIFRALGYESDKQIYEFILKDLLPYNFNSGESNIFNINNDKFNEFSNFLEATRMDSLPIIDRESALMYIYRKLDIQINIIGKDSSEANLKIYEHVLSILYKNLLPHQTNNISKCMYLGYMTFNLLKVHLKYEEVSNRDTFQYKQIETSGYLLSTLFREYYIKFKNRILNIVINELKLTEKGIDKQKIVSLYTDSNNDLLKTLFKNNENIITDGFKRGFKGNWGVRDTQKTLTELNLNEKINRDRYSFNKEGLVQDLLRISYLQTISHLRRIQTPIDSNMKIVGPRKLNATQWGYVCPVDTPDGGNSGLIKNLAIGCEISTSNKGAYNLFLNLFNRTSGFISFITNNYIKPTLYINHTKIFIDGCLIGIYINNDILKIVEFLRLIKRNNLKINSITKLNQLSIAFNYEYKELYILTDFGRCIRLVYVLDKIDSQNILLRNEERYNKENTWKYLVEGHLTDSDRKKISINSLNLEENKDTIIKLKKNQACIEYIDPQESLYTLICLDYNKINSGNYKYLELNGKLIFGALPSIIPFMNHNPKTRNLFCMAQAKQSVGMFATNFNKRMDTMGHILHYPQTPLVVTKISNNIKYNDMGGGANVVVAIATYTGYNQEDSVILNKSALERGIFRSSYYRTYIEYVEKDENFEIPDNSIRKNGNNYNKLDSTGIIKNNSYVNDHDIIIGKTTNNDGKMVDKSITIHHNDFGVVDGIYSDEHSDMTRFCKVRIRMERTPEFADKFGSRHGIKGVVGIILNHEDMPFSKDGIVPDIIVNPHSFPSRMSTGHLLECITGKGCGLLGSFYDASPFENENEAENITNMMETLDYEQYGNEILYNGYTGEQMNVSIFMGMQYYQRMKHMVHDKVQSRERGPRTMLERQPAKGRAREGGLRLGEMERDSLISHGAMNFLKESYTLRSDDYKCYICKMCGRIGIVNPNKNIYMCKFCNNNYSFDEVRIPYCSKLFIQEMESQFVSMRLITKNY